MIAFEIVKPNLPGIRYNLYDVGLFCQVSLFWWSRLMFQKHFLIILIIRHFFSFVDKKFNYFSIEDQYFQANRNWDFARSEWMSKSVIYIRNWVELKYGWRFLFEQSILQISIQSNWKNQINVSFTCIAWKFTSFAMDYNRICSKRNNTRIWHLHTSDIAVPTFYFIFIRIDFDPIFCIVRLIFVLSFVYIELGLSFFRLQEASVQHSMKFHLRLFDFSYIYQAMFLLPLWVI